jgi:hypothetical protein
LKQDLYETDRSLYSYEETINHFDLIDKDITLKNDIISEKNNPDLFSIEYHLINIVDLSNTEHLIEYKDESHYKSYGYLTNIIKGLGELDKSNLETEYV